MGYLADEIIASVKRRASIPTAQSTVSLNDFLAITNEELHSWLVPLVVETREEHFLSSVDVALVPDVYSYRIPHRAIGGSLREVRAVGHRGETWNLPRIDPAELDDVGEGFALEGNSVRLAGRARFKALRLHYLQRPNDLVLAADAAVVTVVDTAARTLKLVGVPTPLPALLPARVGVVPVWLPSAAGEATGGPVLPAELPLDLAAPVHFAGSGITFDIIRSTPGFECVAIDVPGGFDPTTNILHLDVDVPAGVAPGDFLCLTGQAPVPQIPVDLVPLLVQRVVVACLEALGDSEAKASAEAKLNTMIRPALSMLAPRVAGESLRIVNRSSLFRRRW